MRPPISPAPFTRSGRTAGARERTNKPWRTSGGGLKKNFSDCTNNCAPARSGTDLRDGVCRAQLRLPTGARGQGRAAQGRPRLGGGRRPEKLLRHDPAQTTARSGQRAGGRRTGAGAGRKFPPGRRAGSNRRLATDRARHAPRRRHQPAAGESLPRPARSPDGGGGLGDGAVRGRLRDSLSQ